MLCSWSLSSSEDTFGSLGAVSGAFDAALPTLAGIGRASQRSKRSATILTGSYVDPGSEEGQRFRWDVGESDRKKLLLVTAGVASNCCIRVPHSAATDCACFSVVYSP